MTLDSIRDKSACNSRWNVTIALNGDSCKSDVAKVYGWSNEEKGLVFSGFFWGYCAMQGGSVEIAPVP